MWSLLAGVWSRACGETHARWETSRACTGRLQLHSLLQNENRCLGNYSFGWKERKHFVRWETPSWKSFCSWFMLGFSFSIRQMWGKKKNVYGCHFLTLIRWQRTWLSWFKLQKLSILGKFSPKQTVGSTCRNRNIDNCPTGVKFRCHINKLKIYKIMRNCPVRTD